MMTDVLQELRRAQDEAETWRGLAFFVILAIMQWDTMGQEDREAIKAKLEELSPADLRLPWEPVLPDRQAPEWVKEAMKRGGMA